LAADIIPWFSPCRTMTKRIEVAAGLVFRAGKLLITQRALESHCGGLWEFPGGKREPGESFEQCLRRELLEELDMDVRVGNQIDCVVHEYPEKCVELHFYRCEWLAKEPRLIECRDLAWVLPDQLSQYTFPAADACLVTQLSRMPELWDSTGQEPVHCPQSPKSQ